jgi:PAS domain S-box-containing protein
MSQCIHVLLIEDSEDDAVLLQLELERSGYSLCSQRVTTAPALEAALERERWDVILADYSLPRFDAPHALAIVRARQPDTPFIIVSGTIGEEAVVKCMRDGANDFFVKGRTALLAHAIEREMEASRVRRERQAAEQDLRESERRLAQLFSSSPVPYSVTRMSDQRIIEANAAYAELTGYSRDELIGNTVEALGLWVYPEQRAALLDALRGPLPVRNFEFKARTRSGRLGDVLLTADVLDFYGEQCVLSMALDITERKRAEESYRFQAALLDAVGQAVVVTELNGTVISWNKAAEAIYGWPSTDAIGRRLRDLIVTDLRYEEAANIMSRLVLGEPWSGEFMVKRRDGTEFPAYVVDTPLFDAAGTLTGIIGVSADISDLKTVQARLETSESLHRVILSSIFDAVFMTDDAGRFTFVGPSVEAILGYTPDEIRAFGTIQQLFGGEILSPNALNTTGEVQNIDARLTSKAGDLHILLVSARRITVDNGTILYVCRDITERQRAADELRRSELRFRMMTENALDLYALLDTQGQCIYASPTFQRLLHYDPQSLIGSSDYLHLHHPDDWFRDDDWRNLSPRRGRLRTAEGDWLWVEGYSYPVQLDDGEYVVVVGRDISERLQLEEERLEKERLRLELQQQKELGDIKSRFVSMVSHEFRTPLTAIQTSGDLLKHYSERMSGERRNEHLTLITEQVQQLTNLLDEVLVISKADSVGLAFNPAFVDVLGMVGEVVAAVESAPIAYDRIALTSTGAIQAQLDPKLFRQALMNLLVNAIKYSEPRTPVRLDVQADGHMLCVEIEDEGIGIPEADIPHLFNAFHRAGNVGSIAGTGLGLAIVKRAIDVHGGSIAVDSQVGVGTRFTVRVPLRQPVAH